MSSITPSSSLGQSLFEAVSNFQEDNVQLIKDLLREMVNQHSVDGVFYSLNLAVFARRYMKIKRVHVIIIVELALLAQELKLTVHGFKVYVMRSIGNVNELTEMYSHALTEVGDERRKVPISIRRGIALAFNKFPEHSLIEGNLSTNKVSLSDLLKIVHPAPRNDSMSEVFKKILNETVKYNFVLEQSTHITPATFQFFEAYVREDERLCFLAKRDGNVGMVDFSSRILEVYSSSMLSPKSFTSLREHVYKFQASCFAFMLTLEETHLSQRELDQS